MKQETIKPLKLNRPKPTSRITAVVILAGLALRLAVGNLPAASPVDYSTATSSEQNQ
jgi:hypothetical protein